MFASLRPAITLLALFTLITGIVYPLAVTAAAQAAFPVQANGSLIEQNGRVLGSRLIAQPFDQERYFWGRPSATSPGPNNASASTGSNVGPTNPALSTAVNERVAALRAASPGQGATAIPVDLVTSSGSGLDPHVSPAAALFQVQRVALARGLSEDRVRSLVEEHTEPRSFGIWGEPRVNILLLNMALDGL
jgi:potassium-transporting ATPase KdpC subunit